MTNAAQKHLHDEIRSLAAKIVPADAIEDEHSRQALAWLVTVTETASAVDRHTEVSLWFVLSAGVNEPLKPDLREFRRVRWWSRDNIGQADPALFDPHLRRMLAKFDRYRAVGAGR
jgi:hypothetical protein